MVTLHTSLSTILVVGDDVEERSHIAGSIFGLGLGIVQAGTDAALRAVMEHQPDLVILGTARTSGSRDVIRSLGAVCTVPVLRYEGPDVASQAGWPAAGAAPVGRRGVRSKGVYRDDFLTVDIVNRTVWAEDQGEISLTRREFDLLAAFVQHPNQLLTSGQILEMVWGGCHGRRFAPGDDLCRLSPAAAQSGCAPRGADPHAPRDRLRVLDPLAQEARPLRPKVIGGLGREAVLAPRQGLVALAQVRVEHDPKLAARLRDSLGCESEPLEVRGEVFLMRAGRLGDLLPDELRVTHDHGCALQETLHDGVGDLDEIAVSRELQAVSRV
jgi:hypothetical protein